MTYPRPSDEQRQAALAAAQRLRQDNDDPDHLGHTLLFLDEENRALLHVLAAAEHYLHSGQAETEHLRLIQAVEQARRALSRPTGGQPPADFGLE